jgi:amidohydrolase
MPEIPRDVRALEGALVALRRELHAHPELAFQEVRTARRVREFLEGSALDIRQEVGGTGLIASTRNGNGRTVLLRVDLDGLPIQEENATPYASREAGKMHACGHDGHTAMGAAAARVLSARTLPGTARVLFQPAEEGEGGAQAVVRDGGLLGVDVVLGIHLWNDLPVGTIGVKAGPLMAAVDRLFIEVKGKGGHGGMPHLCADPVVAAAHIVTGLQTIVSRNVAPVDSAVITIGAIHGGDAFNVIPDHVSLKGTIRTFDRDLRRSMPERIRGLAEGIASGLGCTAEVVVTAGNPAVVNDPVVAALAKRAAVRVVGAERVVEPIPTMGGEDMAVYFEQVPGCFVFIGSSNAARGLTAAHHSPLFDFDEEALSIGCAFLVEAAEEALRA